MHFPSKILLIGEHTVLHGSQSLSIPFERYKGQWVYTKDVDKRLVDLISQLDGRIINIEAFKVDCENGLSFKSSIPIKFGLGSSGALTAALYKTYAHNQETKIDKLQKHLADIESIFHGKSSGTDALVSYCQSAIRSIDQKSVILNENPIADFPGYVYLFDSKIERSAKTYIQRFGKHVEEKTIDMTAHNEACNEVIDQLLGRSSDDIIFPRLRRLSLLQFDQMPSFMPLHVREIWAQGLQSEDFYFKLCGAGGGGYFLLFARQAVQAISDVSLIPLN